jgi:Tfp pilus assembly protein PilF
MRYLLTFLILASFSTSQAQDILGAQILIEKGVKLHDNGLYDEAIMHYDSALTIDPQNVAAMGEKALTLLAFNKPQEAADLCAIIMQDYKGARNIEFVYTTYGNALDELGKPEESLKVYNNGLVKYPNNAHIHFNKGITLTGLDRYDEAQESIENALKLNPYHAGSHNALARILKTKNLDVMALMAFCRFMVIEPESDRSIANLPYIQSILKANVEKKGKKSKTITINLNPIDVTEEDDGETRPNDFRTVSIMLSFSVALELDKKNKKKSEPELFQLKMESFCQTLDAAKADNYGFYWEYYAPYFIAIKEANLLEPFSYIVYASSDSKSVSKWIKANRDKIDAFYDWDQQYDWER